MLKVSHKEIRYLAVMAAITGLVVAIYREAIIGPPLAPLVLATAELTVALLRWVGLEAARTGAIIAHPGGFAYEIAYTCIGFLPAVFYAAAVLAYPVSWARRLVGVMVGLPLLLALNVLRLLHLFHLGVSDPAAFTWWHEDVWPGIVRLTIIGLWLAWMWWAERSTSLRDNQGCPGAVADEGKLAADLADARGPARA